MISRADFDELFSAHFPSDRSADAPSDDMAPSAECLARWEDDGGRSGTVELRDHSASIRSSKPGHEGIEPVLTAIVAAPILAAAVYGAAWQMFWLQRWMVRARDFEHGMGPSPYSTGARASREAFRARFFGGSSVKTR